MSDAGLDGRYGARFDDGERRAKHGVWREIGAYPQRWVDPSQPALDIAADEGYFIANIQAVERWATDVRDVSAALPPGVRFVCAPGLELVRLYLAVPLAWRVLGSQTLNIAERAR